MKRVQERSRIRSLMKLGAWSQLEVEYRFTARFIKGPSGKFLFDWSSCPQNMYSILQCGDKPLKTRAFLDGHYQNEENLSRKESKAQRHERNVKIHSRMIPWQQRKSVRMALPERVPVRFKLYEEQGGICYFCENKTDQKDWTIEHLTPVCRGGTNDPENLKGACNKCNTDKGSDTEAEYRERKGLLKSQVDRITSS